jgi:isopenicillin N synthase-like dioxygenase
MADTNFPILDVRLLRGDPAAQDAAGRCIRDASTDTGFFYIANHGIDPALIAAVLAESRAFFAQDEAAKLRVDKALSGCNRGYEPMRAQVLEAGAPPDVKEGFYLGQDLAADDPRVLAGRFNHGPNLYPPAMPGFRATMDRYMAEMTGLSYLLMRGLALSLGLPAEYFAPFCADPLVILRLLHYPPQPADPLPDEKGCGAHTDWGCLTLLYQDNAGGLQVLSRGEWIDAPPLPDTFVINLGDMVARWTNDRYRSTLHRVVNLSGRDRYSIPFFFEGNADHQVACLPTCHDEADPPRYAPVSVTDHLLEMYRRTYATA